jgi:hypothetical protein
LPSVSIPPLPLPSVSLPPPPLATPTPTTRPTSSPGDRGDASPTPGSDPSAAPTSETASPTPAPSVDPPPTGTGSSANGGAGGGRGSGGGAGDGSDADGPLFSVGRPGGGAEIPVVGAELVGFDGIDWAVPALTLTVPGLLLMLAVLAQLSAGAFWLPIARRWLGAFGSRRRSRPRRA